MKCSRLVTFILSEKFVDSDDEVKRCEKSVENFIWKHKMYYQSKTKDDLVGLIQNRKSLRAKKATS